LTDVEDRPDAGRLPSVDHAKTTFYSLQSRTPSVSPHPHLLLLLVLLAAAAAAAADDDDDDDDDVCAAHVRCHTQAATQRR